MIAVAGGEVLREAWWGFAQFGGKGKGKKVGINNTKHEWQKHDVGGGIGGGRPGGKYKTTLDKTGQCIVQW